MSDCVPATRSRSRTHRQGRNVPQTMGNQHEPDEGTQIHMQELRVTGLDRRTGSNHKRPSAYVKEDNYQLGNDQSGRNTGGTEKETIWALLPSSRPAM